MVDEWRYWSQGGIVASVVSEIERRGGSDSTRADGRGGAGWGTPGHNARARHTSNCLYRRVALLCWLHRRSS